MKIFKIFLAQLLINLKNAFSALRVYYKSKIRVKSKKKRCSKNRIECNRKAMRGNMFTLASVIENKLLKVGELALNSMSDKIHYVYLSKKTRESGELSLFLGAIPLKSFLGGLKPLYIPLLSKTFQKAFFPLVFRKEIQKGVRNV